MNRPCAAKVKRLELDMANETNDPWESSLPYERFMGRWSRKIAPLFLNWLDAEKNLRWLDVGCGTGALSLLIAETCRPLQVLGIDASDAFIHQARAFAGSRPKLDFQVGDAGGLQVETEYFDLAVSALALNFFPAPQNALGEMRRAVRPGGNIALYVWDYAEGMQMLRFFWDAVVSIDPQAAILDEAVRFPVCRTDALQRLFQDSGLNGIETAPLTAEMLFSDFNDYWDPFLGGTGPAPGYLASLGEKQLVTIENRLRAKLPVRPDGSIRMAARAWAVRGVILKS